MHEPAQGLQKCCAVTFKQFVHVLTGHRCAQDVRLLVTISYTIIWCK